MPDHRRVAPSVGLEPTSCGVDNAVIGHRFRFLHLHRSTTELRGHIKAGCWYTRLFNQILRYTTALL